MMMMMFQLYTELPSGNLSPGSEICGCQEGGQLKCTMLEEVIIINVLTNNLFFKVIKCCEYQPDWRGFQELVLRQVQQMFQPVFEPSVIKMVDWNDDGFTKSDLQVASQPCNTEQSYYRFLSLKTHTNKYTTLIHLNKFSNKKNKNEFVL